MAEPREKKKRNYLFDFPLLDIPPFQTQQPQPSPTTVIANAVKIDDDVATRLETLKAFAVVPKLLPNTLETDELDSAPLSPVGSSVLASRRNSSRRPDRMGGSQAASTSSSHRPGVPRSEPAVPSYYHLKRRERGMQQQPSDATLLPPAEQTSIPQSSTTPRSSEPSSRPAGALTSWTVEI